MSGRAAAQALMLAAATIVAGACGGDPAVEGDGGEVVRGRALSVRMTSTAAGDSVEVRNDTDHDVPMKPFKITVGDGETVDIASGLTPGEAVLRSGETFAFSISPSEEAEEVLIEIGEGDDREIFTLTTGGS
jgi:hypothetical protein